MKDRSTGAPRGFGFVTYVSQITADRVVMHRHVIDGKEVEAKPAVPRDSEVLVRPLPPLPTAGPLPVLPGPTARPREVPVPPSTAMANDLGSKKIFVGGLSHETSESDFVSYFGERNRRAAPIFPYPHVEQRRHVLFCPTFLSL